MNEFVQLLIENLVFLVNSRAGFVVLSVIENTNFRDLVIFFSIICK